MSAQGLTAKLGIVVFAVKTMESHFKVPQDGKDFREGGHVISFNKIALLGWEVLEWTTLIRRRGQQARGQTWWQLGQEQGWTSGGGLSRAGCRMTFGWMDTGELGVWGESESSVSPTNWMMVPVPKERSAGRTGVGGQGRE